MNTKYLLIVGIIILVLGGGIFIFSSQAKKETPAPSQSVQEEDTVQTLSQSDLGLTFSARSDKKAVRFVISKPDEIASVEYEISYTAKGDIPRGAIGQVDVKPGDSQIQTNYIDLGTCSSGKCKYDEVIGPVKLLLKITKKDGKIYQAEQSLSLISE